MRTHCCRGLSLALAYCRSNKPRHPSQSTAFPAMHEPSSQTCQLIYEVLCQVCRGCFLTQACVQFHFQPCRPASLCASAAELVSLGGGCSATQRALLQQGVKPPRLLTASARDRRFDNISGSDPYGNPNLEIPEEILDSIRKNRVGPNPSAPHSWLQAPCSSSAAACGVPAETARVLPCGIW